MSKRAYVPIAPGWLADFTPDIGARGAVRVLFMEVNEPDGDTVVWGVDQDGQVITADTRTSARLRREPKSLEA